MEYLAFTDIESLTSCYEQDDLVHLHRCVGQRDIDAKARLCQELITKDSKLVSGCTFLNKTDLQNLLLTTELPLCDECLAELASETL
ncbi:MAG: hypothetical protein K6L73_07200 [Cellvibrionaceae bacterium]